MRYTINDKEINLDIVGERSYGNNEVLLHQDDDLTSNASWGKIGYHIAPLFAEEEYLLFIEQIQSMIFNILKENQLVIEQKFDLQNYHHLIAEDYPRHLGVIRRTYNLSTALFPLGVKRIEERVSELCNVNVKAKKPFNGEELFHLRIIRPLKTDHNPIHRDVWQEENKDAINIYIPIIGSNELSSLSLVPESHHWPESYIERTVNGAKVNGVQFNVPGLTNSTKPLNIVRPNPGRNELMIFSPYLLHGGAANLNSDMTRISLEMRFWRI